MKFVAPTALAALLAATLAGCDRREPAPAPASNTAVLGGVGQPAAAPAPPALARVPKPPVAVSARPTVQVAPNGAASGLSVWVERGSVMASDWTPATGWQLPKVLEDIGGDASDVQLAANSKGEAMALWRHTVGGIESLRWSRYEPASGWSTPDVLAGALPRSRTTGDVAKTLPPAVPRLTLDEDGRAEAQWGSGFQPTQLQASRFTPGQGWSAPQDLAWAPGNGATAAAPQAAASQVQTR